MRGPERYRAWRTAHVSVVSCDVQIAGAGIVIAGVLTAAWPSEGSSSVFSQVTGSISLSARVHLP